MLPCAAPTGLPRRSVGAHTAVRSHRRACTACTAGFQKIMKKYDKRMGLRGSGMELGPEFEKRLEKEARVPS